jgi:hypothetical protein
VQLLLAFPNDCLKDMPNRDLKQCICGFLTTRRGEEGKFPDIFCLMDNVDESCKDSCSGAALVPHDDLCAVWSRTTDSFVPANNNKEWYPGIFDRIRSPCRDQFGHQHFLIDPPTFELGTRRHVHFIWWGNPKPDSEHFTAAQQAQTQLVTASNVVRGLNFRFYRDLDAQNLDEFAIDGMDTDMVRLATSGNILRTTELEEYEQRFSNVMLSLQHYKAFSAMKDLFMLAVLYRYGGHYFDTTCSFADPSDVPHRLVNPPAPKFPCLPLKKGGKCEVVQRKILETAVFWSAERSVTGTIRPFDSGNVESVMENYGPRIDFWAAYAPRGHLATKVSIQSYLARAAAFGFDGGASDLTIEEPEIVKAFPGKKAPLLRVDNMMKSAEHRNAVISQLIASSGYEGLFAAYRAALPALDQPVSFSDYLTRNFVWEAEDLGGLNGFQTYEIPALALTKTQKNLWR